jgi:hypothetical protein
VAWWVGLLLALGFAIVVTPPITAERWLPGLGLGAVTAGEPARVTVRVPPFAGVQTRSGKLSGGGLVIARGEVATPAQEAAAKLVAAARPRGAVPYVAFFALAFVFGALFTHHMQRSTRGRLLRVQIVSLAAIAALAIAVKVLMLTTAVSILIVPIALLAMVPTMALDRVVGLATGVLAALITGLLVPFDVTVAILLLVQAAAAGLLVAEGPKQRWRAALVAGLVTTLLTAATLLLITYLTREAWISPRAPLSSLWLAAAIGPALAMAIAVPLLPLYQLLVGEITHGKLVELEDLSNPLLRQISERSPGTWQHSLMMANMAEIAANAIGASGRLVRVGAYYHDLGKSLQPKYFIENLQPGETSPHDQLPPEVSCAAIFAHVTEGIAFARRSGLHERIIDFMHMHHGNGVLEYFWSKTNEQGNPRGLTMDQFRYPGHPPQSRETAILAICDAVEAASRTLKKPEPAAIDALVQRIVYGKLHLGQLDESGLSMSDLRRVADALRETIRHANHGRIEYPWQKAQQDASASIAGDTGTPPRLDSLDRKPRRETAVRPAALPPAEIVDDGDGDGAAAAGRPRSRVLAASDPEDDEDLGIVETAPAPAPRSTPTTPPPRPRSGSGSGPSSSAPGARPIGENTQVGLAPAPDPRLRVAAERGARETQLGRPAALDPGVHAGPTQPLFPVAPLAGPAPLPSVDDLDTPVMPAMLGELVRVEARADAGEPPDSSELRRRASALPAGPARKPPTLPPPPSTLPGLRMGGPLAARGAPSPTPAPPPQPADAEEVIASAPPPPPRGPAPPSTSAANRGGGDPVGATRLPAVIAGASQPRAEDWAGEPRRGEPIHDPDRTEPSLSAANRGGGDLAGFARGAGRSPVGSMPRFEPPVQPSASAPPAAPAPAGDPPWVRGLAARVDAVLRDEWSNETPVVPPSKAELQALLGTPDPTRQQSIDEIEALHRAAEELYSEPELLVPPTLRRVPHPTSEVDPDQIEAAIELAPPARRAPNLIAVAKPKKPE